MPLNGESASDFSSNHELAAISAKQEVLVKGRRQQAQMAPWRVFRAGIAGEHEFLTTAGGTAELK